MIERAADYRDTFATEIRAVADRDVHDHISSLDNRNSTAPRLIRRKGPDPRRSWMEITFAWCVIGPRDKNNAHQFALQWVKGIAGGPRVRVGCKYKTLPQAWRYIRMKSRGWEKNKYAQAECIIRLMLLQAQAAGLPGAAKLKFDASLNKKRRK